MSLQAPAVYIIPEDTEHVARQAFPKGNPYLLIADELGSFYSNAQFAELFAKTGQPGLDPARLALITVFQFMEGLSDAQATTAVAARIDWKYALALPLTYAGFDSSVLSEFRTRLLAGDAEALLLDALLDCLQEKGLLKARGRARTDSTHVLAAVRVLSRLVLCGETLRAALNDLADTDPAWLREQITAEWFARYSRRVEEYRLPRKKEERAAWAATLGADGQHLLTALYAASAPPALRRLPAVQVLRAVWVQQFHAPDEAGVVRWREAADQPAGAHLIVSPYDAEARLSAKREQAWTGYKVHITETCDEATPHVITHVETTPATTADAVVLAPIHTALAAKECLPAEHLVDSGYVSGEQLVASQKEHQIRLVGPIRANTSWQATAGAGFAAACFAVDWDAQQVTCPAGQRSRFWNPEHNERGKNVIQVQFDTATCQACDLRAQCTKAKTEGRGLTLRPQEQHLAVAARRAEQETAAFQAAYAARAGIEGTLSQGIRVCDLRDARYRGLAKTRLQHILIAVAVSLLRVVAWLQERPRARTRISAFADLANWPTSQRATAAA